MSRRDSASWVHLDLGGQAEIKTERPVAPEVSASRASAHSLNPRFLKSGHMRDSCAAKDRQKSVQLKCHQNRCHQAEIERGTQFLPGAIGGAAVAAEQTPSSEWKEEELIGGYAEVRLVTAIPRLYLASLARSRDFLPAV